MFLNILRISASNVSKMFLNRTIISYICYLDPHKPTGSINTLSSFWAFAAIVAGTKEIQ